MKQSWIFVSIVALIAIQSCVHEQIVPVIEPDPGPAPCAPDSVFFAQQVLPIFQSSCAIPECHDAETAQEDIILDSYENIMASDEITPGDLTDGDIFELITDDDLDDRMPPQPQSALSDEQINLIAQWILQGAPNNSCNGLCDPTVFTYSGGIRPIIENHCEGCHSGSDPIGGFTLTSFTDVESIAIDGSFLGAVSGFQGYEQMPQNGSLSQCQISVIEAWINEGSQNN